MFDEQQALTRCTEVSEIANQVIKLFSEPEYLEQMGEKAFQVVAKNRGALERQFQLIDKSLKDAKQSEEESKQEPKND